MKFADLQKGSKSLSFRGRRMTITIDAIYENGVFKPKRPITLDDGTEVQLTLQTPATETEDPFEAVIGTCDGPPDGAANHDIHLYGDPR